MTTEVIAKPDTDYRCKHCDRPMWRKGTPLEDRAPGSISHSGRGACTACYHRLYTLGGHPTQKAKHRVPQRRTVVRPADTTWQEQAACRDADPELFYHPEGETGFMKAQRISDARAVCAECPVLEICRANTLHEEYGIWGGLSEDERAAIRAGKPTEHGSGLMLVPAPANLPTKGNGLDPGPVAAHVAGLIEAGFNPTAIGRFVGVAPDAVRALVKGKTQHIHRLTAQKLLSVQVRKAAA